MPQILYLHGFASSPDSTKARIFQEKFARIGLRVAVPHLVEGEFRDLTISGQLAVIERAAGDGPVSLIGSSLGGYLAALYAARHPLVERLVLLAPAFGFARSYAASLGEARVSAWRETGFMNVMHYGEGGETALGWQLMEDAMRYEDEPAITQPCLIYHGAGDTVVPVQVSRAFARTRTCSELREVDSDHQLLDVVEEIWEGARQFLLV